MAEPKWTDPQKDAIESRGRDVLVSAAAGSGKTAVLTERLFRTLSEDRVDLSRVLVVTFTVKAAEELRARVRERLEQAVASSPDDAFLASQLQAIGTAKISTIDSYCKSLIDERFSSLGLPAGTSIIQEQEERALWEKILPPLLDETLKKDPESGKYLSSLGDTTERRVNALLDLYSALLRYPDPVGKLASCAEDFGKAAENGLAGSVWWELLKDRFSAIVDHFHPFMEQAVSDCDSDPVLDRARGGAYRAILSTLEKISAALKTGKPEALWDAVLSFEDVSFCGIKFEKDARTALHAELRDKFRKTVKEWRTDFFAKHRPENAKSEFAACKKAADALLAVLRPFRERELEEKKRRRVLSFNDMEQYARILLIGENGEPTDAAREISDRLDAVFIDEYQDTSPIQDAVFSAIAGKGRRFLVGDVKQCIYKFRSADPRIFQSYRKREDFRNVMLADNFRSEQRIVDFVNAVFDRIFSFGDLDYDPALDALKCHPNTGSLLPVRGVSVEAGREAAFIAAEIEKIRREEAEKEKEPSIAVLFRSSKNTDGEKIAELAQRLRAKGIPCSAPTDSVFFKKKEVLLVKSLLRTIDSPWRDVDLCACLLSPLFGFRAGEIARVRAEKRSGETLFDSLLACREEDLKEKTAYLKNFFEKYRALAAALPVERFFDRLIREKDLLSFGRENVIRLYRLCLFYDDGAGRSLSGFAEYLEKAASGGASLPSFLRETPGEENGVTITTVHQSKGLQYDAVILCDRVIVTDKNKHSSDKLFFCADEGLYLPLPDPSGLSLYAPLPAFLLHKARKAAEQEEETRILYTAFTRAKERLVLVKGVPKEKEKDPEKETKKKKEKDGFDEKAAAKEMPPVLSRLFLENKHTWTDYVEAAIGKESVPPFFLRERAASPAEEPVEKSGAPAASGDPPRLLSLPADEKTVEELKKRFSFVYPHPLNVPAKVSVSRLYPDMLDPEEGSLDLSGGKSIPAGFDYAPSFLEEEGAAGRSVSAEAGSATHLFMQFCDFSKIGESGVEKEIARMKEKRFLTDRQASLIRVGEVETFLSSPLFERMKKAKKLIREQRFNAFFPAEEFTKTGGGDFAGEEILVQGVIDCVVEEEDGLVLVDYKTDRVSGEGAEETLRERHSLQLDYYAAAVREILRRPVKEKLIYSFALGKEVPVGER